ncbi:unnamed protein product [Pseudo-nitzschia multistriata]|uniref:Protein kinase domain-containing protein n=1 Tax=Pseudo-nitzschia multistriata TaxID=183589 RepID=A0A448ZB78_9STRA|nr:unnamed protein product [Pseudo-nitzschia multistriata]
MSPPNSSSNKPFVIPSLIPPLPSSSATSISQKENIRFHSTHGNNKTAYDGTVKRSLFSKYQQDTEKQKLNNDSFVSAVKDGGVHGLNSHRLRSVPHLKDSKRKALSPVENLSSVSRRNLHNGKNNDSSICKSPSFASPLPTIPRSSSSIDKYNRSGKKRVLLFGETMESLFCLNKAHSTEEQYALCNSIVDGSRTDDPSVWSRVLELTRAQHRKTNLPNSDNSNCNKENLIRLHRRATLRFSLRDMPGTKDFNNSSRKHQRDIFDIWLSYAKVHAKVGNLEESRRTFKFMEDNKSALMDYASSIDQQKEEFGSASVFYLSFADFESNYGHDKTRARQILLRGIKEKAEPISVLEEALTVLDCSDVDSDEVTRRFRMKGTPASEKKKEVSLGSIKFEINPSPNREYYPTPQFKRQILGCDVRGKSPKRPRLDRNKSTETEAVSKKLSTEVQPMTTDSSKKTNKSSSLLGETVVGPTSAIGRSASQGKPPVSKTRLALTSRLARKGLSGKAKRVDCSVTYDDDDFSSDDDSQHDSTKPTLKTQERSTESKSTEGKSSSKLSSFKKLDLSYMWEWDPNKKGKDQNEIENQKSSDASNSTGSGVSTNNTQLSTINTHQSGSSEENASAEKDAAHSSSTDKQSQRQSQTTEQTTPAGELVSMKKEENDSATLGELAKNPESDVDRKKLGSDKSIRNQVDNSAMSRREALVAKANLEFLPLVHEDNILKVRGSTYAKLGVIGKGGSCKVYRALSKKCSVVAIKKVKLAGMEKKAIEGYANEISLLKRLRGNPAIIQMYDSEVDLQRKSIFVVMELGEVDLNHVLQQRALSERSRSLNMNFIRLTWQQMLSAVHCIHEERIIHSDLKPANFLFVRGALKLIDFGIAKAIVNDDTTNIYRENHIGTLNYMSPEAILDTGSGEDGPRMKIGRASDVWSLGCILYEMVYGKTPFYKLHFIQKLQAIVNPKHKIHFPEDDEAEAAIHAMKLCLRRNPEERPPIVGKNGLLNDHWFLHSRRHPK